MLLPNLQSPAYSDVQENVMDEPEQPEWIPTREVMAILHVTSTQGVWYIIARAEREHKILVRRRNIGTEEMPRYLLNRFDIELVAQAMGKT